MFDKTTSAGPAVDLVDLAGMLVSVTAMRPGSSDPDRIDQIALIEQVMHALAGLRAEVSATFADSQIEQQRSAGVRARRLGTGIAEQLGLARGVSPTTAGRDLGLARALRDRLPKLARLLRAGAIGEWPARLVANETKHLSTEDARAVDAELCKPRPDGTSAIEGVGARRVETAARYRAQSLDPAGYVDRLAKATEDRRVGLRPAPDTMSWFSALLPVQHGVAVHASLDRKARALRAAGDPRTLDQLRADLLVEQLSGRAAEALPPVEIRLVMTPDTLFGGWGPTDPLGGSAPAVIDGYGYCIPGPIARYLATGPDHPGHSSEASEASDTHDTHDTGDTHDAGDARGASDGRVDESSVSSTSSERRAARVWLRRLSTDPVDGTVTGLDPRARLFNPTLRRLIQARDQVCRMPYCDAPIRHIDHVRPHRHGGETSVANSQAACESWNYVKELPGWQVTHVNDPTARSIPPPKRPGTANSGIGRRDRTAAGTATRVLKITTPTGHTYWSRPPPALPLRENSGPSAARPPPTC